MILKVMFIALAIAETNMLSIVWRQDLYLFHIRDLNYLLRIKIVEWWLNQNQLSQFVTELTPF